MTKITANARLSKVLETPLAVALPRLPEAMEDLRVSVERFCLLAGVEALGEMLAEDAQALCGPRHGRSPQRRGHRWGTTTSEIAYHGGKVKITRPRVRDLVGQELRLASWQALSDPELLRAWAMNLMVLTVSTRKYRRAVRLSEGDLPALARDGTSKSAVSRRFVAISRKKLEAWLSSDLSGRDLLVIQIDGIHIGDHVLVAAVGVDGQGEKHVLAIAEGATENSATVQALIDNLIDRGLDPEIPRLFVVDGANPTSAIRGGFQEN
jgi:transposase-like protein